MELRHLRYFVAVAEEQNITRAAVSLHVSQPTLSRQIRDLEDELGIVLFERCAKSLRLTEAGRVFLTETRIALQGVQDAVQMAKAVAAGKRAEIHVGYAPSLTVELLPRALRYFRGVQPWRGRAASRFVHSGNVGWTERRKAPGGSAGAGAAKGSGGISF